MHFVLFFETFNVFNKEDEMFKFFILFALTTVLCLQCLPAYCGVSRTVALQVSVTIPPHVMLNNNLGQLVQTQTMIRNNQNVQVTSIVLP